MLFLRECVDRKVPCRDKENGLFDDMLPGLLLSGCDIEMLLFCEGLRLRSILEVSRLKGMNEFGLRLSDGERRVRKLWDLALRIIGKCLEWWEEGPFSCNSK